jgi:hypothetical protein
MGWETRRPVDVGPPPRENGGDEKAGDDQVWDRQQPGLDQDQTVGEALGVRDLQVGRVVGASQGEWWVSVGAQGRVHVEPNPPVPPQDTDVEVEQRARVATGEQDREAGDHGGDHERDQQERQHQIVRDGQEHLSQPQPAGQLGVQLPGQSDRGVGV